jgi:hypothetical protein
MPYVNFGGKITSPLTRLYILHMLHMPSSPCIASDPHPPFHLRAVITSIHNDVSACGVARCITGKEEIDALQLMSLALSAHWDLILPYIFGLLRHEVADLRRHIAWGHGVGSRKLYPLDRQTLAEVDHACLGCVIGGLQLRDVDDVARHRCGGDEGAGAEAFDSLLLLLAPDGSTATGAVESAVEVGVDDLFVVVELAVDHGTLGPGDAGVGNEDVEAVVEFGDLCFDGFFHRGGVLHIDLVGLA